MYATDFEFAGKRLSHWGFIIANFDGSAESVVSSGADISFNQVRSGSSDRFNLYSANYDEPYTANFSIMRDPCNVLKQEDMFMTTQEITNIQGWLCRREYAYFKIDQPGGFRQIHWEGTFSSKQVLLGGNVIGLNLTFHSASPYAYFDEVELGVEFNPDDYINIRNISQSYGVVYLDAEIEFLESGDWKLVNSLDDYDNTNRCTEIKNVKAGEIVTLNGESMIITSNDASHTENMPKDFNFLFPRLFSTDESQSNKFTSNLKCKAMFRYTPACLVGI